MAVVAGLNVEAMKLSGENVPIYLCFKLKGADNFESGTPLQNQPVYSDMVVLEIRVFAQPKNPGDDLDNYFECFYQYNYQTRPANVQRDTALMLLRRLFETELGLPIEQISFFTLYQNCFLGLLPFKKTLFMPQSDVRGFLAQNLICRCRLQHVGPHRLTYVQAFSPTKLKAQFFEVIPSACQQPRPSQPPVYLRDAQITQEEVYKLSYGCDFMFVSDLAPQMLPKIKFDFANCVVVNEALELQSKQYGISEYARAYLQYQEECVKAEVLISLGQRQLVLNNKSVSDVFDAFVSGQAYSLALEAAALNAKEADEERTNRLKNYTSRVQTFTTRNAMLLRSCYKEPEEESCGGEGEDGDSEASDAPRRGKRAHLDGGLGYFGAPAYFDGINYLCMTSQFGTAAQFTTYAGFGAPHPSIARPATLQFQHAKSPGLPGIWGGK